MRKLLRPLFRYVLVLLLLLAGVVLVNTLTFTSRQAAIDRVPPSDLPDGAVQRLGTAATYSTISYPDRIDTLAFAGLDTFLRQAFPLVDSLLEYQPVGEWSRLYRWPGRNAQLPPVLLLSHLDVVPVDESSRDQWEAAPFSGDTLGGYLYGRGTLDDKVGVIGILEAVEWLLSEGYEPQRSVYLAFGHDEEVSGKQGARQIADHLRQQGVQPEFVLDEGMFVIENAVNGLSRPLAMIGVAEKGYVTLTLTARVAEAGHSSMPPRATAVGRLGKALARLEEHPFPTRMDGVFGNMLDYIGPEMSPLYKALFANRWLTAPLIARQLKQDPASAASIRTTMAPTMVRGGFKENVLPTRASARVNFRILPGETVASVVEQVREVVADEQVLVAVSDKSRADDPSPVSPANTFGFELIQRSIQEVFPDAVVAPALTIAMTDSRHYLDLTDKVYRFLPIRLDKSDLSRIHGINERIEIEGYRKAVRFYRRLLLNSTR